MTKEPLRAFYNHLGYMPETTHFAHKPASITCRIEQANDDGTLTIELDRPVSLRRGMPATERYTARIVSALVLHSPLKRKE